MNSLLTIVCLYICVSFTYSESNKDTKKDIKEKMNIIAGKKYNSIKDIPKDHIETLKEYFDITDPPPIKHEEKYKDFDYKDYESHSAVNGLDYTSYEYTEDSNEANDTSNETESGGCSLCKLREQDKQFRLANIKGQILNKLGFSNSNLPNMTGKNFPRTPSLQKLIDQYEMQGDQPYGGMDEYLPEDEYYGQVQRAYTISQPCKFILS